MNLKTPIGYSFKSLKRPAFNQDPAKQNFKPVFAQSTEESIILPDTQEDNRQVKESNNEFRQHSFNIPDKMFNHPKESELRSLCEISPFGMIITSSGGEIVIVNEVFASTLGYNTNELIGKNINDICSPEENTDRPAAHPIVDDPAKAPQIEKKYLHKNGNTVHVISKTAVFHDIKSKPSLILTQIVDITDRKDFEELLQQRNSELERANAELDRFLYSTSHDLRAPLRSVLGLIYIMQNESNLDTMKTYMDMMRSSVNRMDAFIKEIVDLSRNSQQGIKIEKVNFNTIVTEIFENLQYIPGAEKIEFSFESSDGIDFYSDASRIRIILSNLISNAITYHNLSQEKPFIKVVVNTKNKYGVVEVIDNGRGIQKEHQEKIFDMFYRASDDAKGSGLGLYIVKEAVNKLNGDIHLKSKWGVGSNFSIKLVNFYNKANT